MGIVGAKKSVRIKGGEMKDRYLPPNLGNGPAFLIDGMLFSNEAQARRYIMSLGGWNDREAIAYLQQLYDAATGDRNGRC